ncbi:MAG: caspase family protein, partial [Phycisphaerae bacterium]
AEPVGGGPVGGGGGGQAIALCIGLNAVDPQHYAGWAGTLLGCEPDANDMTVIANGRGFATTKLLTKAATRDAVLKQIRQAAGQLKNGGIFMISYSGHGGQVPDAHAPPQDNGMAQTWCLYDGELLDKELYAEWSKFAAGVRVLVISDSCHSEGIAKMVPADYRIDLARGGPAGPDVAGARRLAELKGLFDATAAKDRGVRMKALPPAESIATYQAEKVRYDKIARDVARPASPIAPWVMTLAACKNDQLAGDTPQNGIFTAALKGVWAGGAFAGDYRAFHTAVAAAAAKVRPAQDAQRRMIDNESDAYWRQRPFTTAAP